MADTLDSTDDEPGTGPSARANAMDRPTGVTVLAVLYAIGGIIMLLSAAAAVTMEGADGAGVFGAFLFLAVSIAFLAVTYGMWTGLRWAWFGAIVLEVFAFVSSILSMLAGDILSGFVGLVIAGIILWYLLKPDVQAWFGVSYGTPWRGGRPT